MNTRMARYDNNQDINSTEVMSRVKRNQDKYNSNDMNELSRFKVANNVSVISNISDDIDINKIKDYINSKELKEEKRRRLNLDIPDEEDEVVERQEFRNYDINSVLESARESKETDYEDQRHRKLNNTQYDILKKIKIHNDTEELNEDDEFNTEEKTVVDLINNIQNNSLERKTNVGDLFKDLMGDNENTVVMAPISETEINKQNMKETLANITTDLEMIKEPVSDETQELLLEKERIKMSLEQEQTGRTLENTTGTSRLSSIDKSFYTNSMSFSKTDFEGFEDLEKSTRTSVFIKVGISLAIVLLLITVFLILNSVFDWNII